MGKDEQMRYLPVTKRQSRAKNFMPVCAEMLRRLLNSKKLFNKYAKSCQFQ